MKKIVLFLLLVITPFIVLAYPKGDVDGSGLVDNKDYVLVRNHILKKSLLTGDKLTRADVDGQNGVDNRDYVLIRNIIVNGSSNTPTPTPTLTEEETICESVKGNASIDYKSFISLSKKASSNDKYSDDYYAIKAAHDCANKYNKPVVVTKGTYHIYKKNSNTISVQTNTDFSDSTIYIHDEEDIYNYKSTSIYTIEQNTANKCTSGTKTGFTNAFTSLVPSTGNYFVSIIEQNGEKVYYRRHNCDDGKTCQAKEKSDVYRVYNGNVQDPMIWNYNNSEINYTVCPIPSNKLVFKNATIKTVTRLKCEKCAGSSGSQPFKKRGISVHRSNTEINNIHHSFVDNNLKNTHVIYHKYSGFFTVGTAGDVTIKKCTVYAICFKTSSGCNSTYDISISKSANVTLNGVKMFDDGTYNQMESSDWGVTATYESKNLIVLNSKLNRVDAHRNILGLTVKDSTIGTKGITMSGTGDSKNNKMVIENVTWKYAKNLISLRGDYGTTWNGTISIKNSKVEKAPSATVSVVGIGSLSSNSKAGMVFKQPLYNPVKISIDGLKVNSSNVTKLQILGESQNNMKKYYLEHFQRKTNKNEATVISKKNITGVKTVTNYAE